MSKRANDGSKKLRGALMTTRGAPGASFSEGEPPALISTTPEWDALKRHKEEIIDGTHLRELLNDEERNEALTAEYNGVYCDFARQRVVPEVRDDERTNDLIPSIRARVGSERTEERLPSSVTIPARPSNPRASSCHVIKL